jgi:hypothetical protein
MFGSGALTQDKVERPDKSSLGADMSRKSLWNPDKEPDQSSWDLAAEDFRCARHVWSRSWTCSAKVTGTWLRTRIWLVKPRIR